MFTPQTITQPPRHRYPTTTILKGHIVLDRGKITFKKFEPVFAELDHSGLDLYDYEGKKVARYNQVLSFFDKNKTVRLTADVNLDGNPHLQLYDKSKNLRAVLGHTLLSHQKTGSTGIRAESSLVLFNEKGNVRSKGSLTYGCPCGDRR